MPYSQGLANIVPVVIETIHQGIYGYRAKATIPQIAGGAGIPISGSLKIGRKWTYKGHYYSYVNARCEPGTCRPRVNSSSGMGPSSPVRFSAPAPCG
jgi:hypothetical protein